MHKHGGAVTFHKTNILNFVILFAIFLAICAFLILSPVVSEAVNLSVALPAVIFVFVGIFLFMFTGDKPIIQVDGQGIQLKGYPFVRWGEIDSVKLVRLERNPRRNSYARNTEAVDFMLSSALSDEYIMFDVTNEELYKELGFFQKVHYDVTVSPFRINLKNLSAHDTDRLLAEISKYKSVADLRKSRYSV